MKRIAFGGKPVPKPGAASADDWVSDRSNHRLEPNKRLTIDVPLSLHQRVKSQCAIQGLKMADVIRDLLDEKFPGERTQDALRIDESTPAVANTTL